MNRSSLVYKNKQRVPLAEFKISKHAIRRFVERSSALGLAFSEKNPEKTIRKLLTLAKPEKPRCKVTKWELFKRKILYKSPTKTYVAYGWRFVVDIEKNTVVTVERIKVKENYIGNYSPSSYVSEQFSSSENYKKSPSSVKWISSPGNYKTNTYNSTANA